MTMCTAYLPELYFLRLSSVMVCIDWMYPADRITDINRTGKFCSLQAHSVEQFAACPV